MGDSGRPIQLLVDFAELLIALWGRCYDESLLEPIWFLVDLVGFALQLNATAVAPLVIRHLVPTAVATVCTAAERAAATAVGPPPHSSSGLVPFVFPPHGRSNGLVNPNNDTNRFRGSGGGRGQVSMENPPPTSCGLDSTQVLSLLNFVAQACASAPSSSAYPVGDVDGASSPRGEFWKLVPLDFVGLLLNPANQRLEDVVCMLQLLCTSVLPDSVGPVVEGKDADMVARLVIDRVSAKLCDLPRMPTKPRHRHAVRLAALRTLIAFATSPFGAKHVAAHDHAPPRIVTLLSTSIDALYDLDLSPHLYFNSDCSGSLNTWEGNNNDCDSAAATAAAENHDDDARGLNNIIATATRLLHALVVEGAGAGPKISAAHGGAQRYMVALARLNFADEDGVLEAGVGVETMQLAHELLEIASTPDEGESMTRAFVLTD